MGKGRTQCLVAGAYVDVASGVADAELLEKDVLVNLEREAVTGRRGKRGFFKRKKNREKKRGKSGFILPE